MANINLAANSFERSGQSNFQSKGIAFILVVLVILIIGYVSIYLIKKNTISQTDAINSQYAGEYAKLTGGENKDIMDFQNRIVAAKELLAQENSGYSSLPIIERSRVSGMYLKSLDFTQAENGIKINGVADDFNVMARQILSLKQTNYFSGVTAGTTSLDDKGKINFSLELKIK